MPRSLPVLFPVVAKTARFANIYGPISQRQETSIRYTVMRTILAAGALLLVSSANLLVQSAPASAPLDDAMRAFWDAGSPVDAEKRVAKVVATHAPFDAVLSRLKVG